jgi:hypothetical protein
MCQKAVCYAAGTLTLSHKSLLNAEGALIGSKEVILAPNDTPPKKTLKRTSMEMRSMMQKWIPWKDQWNWQTANGTLKKEKIKPGIVAHACIPALRRLRKQEHEFETSLDYSVRLCLKKQGLGCSLLIGCFARLRRALCPISSTARKKK